MKTKVGIIGGAGYTAGELLRLLIHHPHVEIGFVHSTSNAGNPITDIHEGLIGDTDLVFTDRYDLHQVDALFLCSAHGDSRQFIESNDIPGSLKIIDLAMDYRHKATAGGFVYGLPELNKPAIQKAVRIANPGCFATAIQLALLPMADKNVLKHEIHVHAITGSTGAGVKPAATSHFSWRNNNISVYKAFEHQHLQEICESLNQAASKINFIPVRGDFARGIFASVYTECDWSLEEATQVYSNFYKDAAFTFLTDKNIALKQVVNTNKCVLHLEKHDNKLLILSVIDNLLKGASGQAVQNFNLMFGWDEKAGLNLKPSAF
ncbi:MAG: N-acetyl-gamma-glutamyl-phosphate reductase [Candidatus Ordinivivax streblomastigis]|uniref:N-acetyl-gamma-glutamyl-phosphate reductase n=1 Tax=Candidatus Ordinivivax streblomastigis TaxID=2540710 RepID=A0A5M8NZN0_9BACT|nr:MAG: N-acetyl-gamma-glutamyl-phosphate reductase [Candidatus Ordinivivax streblomastigis]